MKSTTSIKHRRRREGKTDYKARYALLKSRKPRLVIRKSSKNIHVQVIEYDPNGDRVVVFANSRELLKLGWKCGLGNIPASYLTGFLAGVRAKGKIEEAVLDIGMQISTRGSRIYSALKGFIDAGIRVPHSSDIFPPEERIEGRHIAEWSDKAQKPNFLKYKIDPKDICKNFQQVKNKIIGEHDGKKK